MAMEAEPAASRAAPHRFLRASCWEGEGGREGGREGEEMREGRWMFIKNLIKNLILLTQNGSSCPVTQPLASASTTCRANWSLLGFFTMYFFRT